MAEEFSIQLPPETIREAVGRVLGGGHFFVASPRRLRVEHVASEQAVFEVFRGHLLDASHSGRREEFETWNVFLDEASTPAECRWCRCGGNSRVGSTVRRAANFTHGFEAYEETPGVILSREAQKWVAELVGTIAPDTIGQEDWKRS